MTRTERWTIIEKTLRELEPLVDAADADENHPDHHLAIRAAEHVHCAESMALFALEGDQFVDPPPRGASREAWSEASPWLRDVVDPEIKAAVANVRLAYRGKA